MARSRRARRARWATRRPTRRAPSRRRAGVRPIAHVVARRSQSERLPALDRIERDGLLIATALRLRDGGVARSRARCASDEEQLAAHATTAHALRETARRRTRALHVE